MKKKSKIIILLLVLLIFVLINFYLGGRKTTVLNNSPEPPLIIISTEMPINTSLAAPTETPNNALDKLPPSPLYIESLRAREYPASEIIIEETLEAGSNYKRLIASYLSDGYKIYGLLTIPDDPKPKDGFPTILFLHGYIAPDTYVTTADYVVTQDGLANSGFVTYKPDLRGHGRSEGIASGAHFSETYVVDSLNAISALEIYEEVDPNRIGVWGHSNGGLMGLRVIVITDKIKACVFWAGVVGSYPDMLETYISKIDFLQRLAPIVIEEFGSPSANPDYWNRIDPYTYLDFISGPVQLHHGISDSSVPIELSISLSNTLQEKGKEVEFYQYAGAGHNMYGTAFSEAMNRTILFFKTHLK